MSFIDVVLADETAWSADDEHLCVSCKRRHRMVGSRLCGWCAADERDRFSNEGTDPYREGFE